jgi:hypothetical protein
LPYLLQTKNTAMPYCLEATESSPSSSILSACGKGREGASVRVSGRCGRLHAAGVNVAKIAIIVSHTAPLLPGRRHAKRCGDALL